MIIKNIFLFINVLNLLFYQLVKSDIESNIPAGISNEIVRITERIIGHCFKKEKGQYLLVNNWNTSDSSFFNSIFNSMTPINLIGTNENNIFKDHKRIQRGYRINETHFSKKNKPATSVTIIVSSNTSLAMLLEDIRNSIWWNHAAFFLIVNQNLENSCSMADTFLNTVWIFNILSAVYLCRTVDNQLFFYAFNPFTNLAPVFWNFVRSNHLNNERWTLLEHFIQNPFDSTSTYDSSICDSLYFDKTNNLKGYNIKATKTILPSLNSNDCVFAETHVINMLIKSINVNVSSKIYNEFGFIDEYGQPQGPIKDVLTSTVDITMTLYFLRDFWKHQTYPISDIAIKIVSLKHSIMYFERFFSILDSKIWMFFLSINLTSIIGLKCILNESIFLAVLDYLRLIIYTPILKQPKTGIRKIILIGIIFYAFLTTSLLQSYLSALNTVPIIASTIDSVDDLIKSNITPYGTSNFLDVLEFEEIRKRFHPIASLSECVHKLLEGDLIVCIDDNNFIRFYLRENAKIHISKDSLGTRSFTYITAVDSPLLHKFNRLLRRFDEGGFIYRSFDLEKLCYVKESYKDQIAPLILKDLYGSFYNLFTGYITATISFLLEILIYNIKNLTFKMKNYKRKRYTKNKVCKIVSGNNSVPTA